MSLLLPECSFEGVLALTGRCNMEKKIGRKHTMILLWYWTWSTGYLGLGTKGGHIHSCCAAEKNTLALNIWALALKEGTCSQLLCRREEHTFMSLIYIKWQKWIINPCIQCMSEKIPQRSFSITNSCVISLVQHWRELSLCKFHLLVQK